MSKREGRNVNTWAFTVFGKRGHLTVDPKNIQAVLATQFKDFGLGQTRCNNFSPLLGHGIFAADGKGWEHARAMLRPQFARDQVSDLNLEEAHVQNMMRALPIKADGWTGETDIQTLFFRLTLDSATEFLFGESVDSQLIALQGEDAVVASSNRNEKVFAYAFDKAQDGLATGARLGQLYWLIHYKADFKKQCKDVHDFIDYYVQRALNLHKEKRDDGDKEKYVFLEALAAQTSDPEELRSQLVNILLAGRDTTASTLSWIFFLLIKNPTVFTELRRAVVESFGTYDAPLDDITFSSLKNCQYLQHCLNETLRLHPVVPLNSRRALVDTTLPRGGGPDGLSPVFIPKGTEVNYAVHVMHRREDLWEDAEAFKPQRWVGRRPGWEYLPFNGGPRICIGQQFALTEASYVVVRLLQRFDAIAAGPSFTGETKQNVTLTSSPGEGVHIRLREARQ
ncbi:hypothetical protein MBLNU459_g8025t2 [Dothideomycetes sp. NU459]